MIIIRMIAKIQNTPYTNTILDMTKNDETLILVRSHIAQRLKEMKTVQQVDPECNLRSMAHRILSKCKILGCETYLSLIRKQ